MLDNRLPLLIEAAKEALIALGDNAVHRKLQHKLDPKAMLYCIERTRQGKDLDTICKAAFEKLQIALSQFSLEELQEEKS